MSEPTSGTYGCLLANYGPLLTLKHMAEDMRTTPNVVRIAIARKQQPFAVALSGARRRQNQPISKRSILGCPPGCRNIGIAEAPGRGNSHRFKAKG